MFYTSGWVHVICGCMFCGKTDEMLRLLRNRFGERQSIDPKDASFIEQMSSMVDASLKERDKPKS